jgi:hypothetical protein
VVPHGVHPSSVLQALQQKHMHSTFSTTCAFTLCLTGSRLVTQAHKADRCGEDQFNRAHWQSQLITHITIHQSCSTPTVVSFCLQLCSHHNELGVQCRLVLLGLLGVGGVLEEELITSIFYSLNCTHSGSSVSLDAQHSTYFETTAQSIHSTYFETTCSKYLQLHFTHIVHQAQTRCTPATQGCHNSHTNRLNQAPKLLPAGPFEEP